MSKKGKNKYERLKKKRIWPSVVLLCVVTLVCAILVIALGTLFLSYVLDEKMEASYDKVQLAATYMENAVDNEVDYSEALSNYAHDNDIEAAFILNENKEIIASYGDITADLEAKDDAYTIPVKLGMLRFDFSEDYKIYLNKGDSGFDFGNTITQFLFNEDAFYDDAYFDENGQEIFFEAMKVPVSSVDFWIGSAQMSDGNYVAIKQTVVLQRRVVLYTAVLVIVAVVLIAVVFIVMLCNIISKVHIQRRMTKLSFTDNITGGNNWNFFEESAKKILTRRKNSTKGYVVVDFEWMKYRNFCGLHGAEAGDQALEAIYRFITSKLQKQEICARYAKANFAILMYSKDAENDQAIIESRIREWIDSLPEVLKHANLIFHVGIYDVDICFGNPDNKPNKNALDIEKMYNNAGIARASITADNSSEIAHFNQKMWDDQMWEHKIEDSMQAALDNEEFLVFIQPKYNPSTKELAGAEALIRWQHPVEGFLPPGRFIPIFEKSDFITKIDDYMISHVAKLQAKWLAEGKKIVPISVNVSRIHFAMPDLAEHIAKLVDAYEVPHEYVEIELTESAFFDDKNALLNTIHRLKELGFDVSMDDFGAGYSSLNSLKDLPLDVLKLDADFFRGELDSDRGEIVVSQAIALAKQLRMRIVAEGIEKKEQVDFLAEAGCDMIQGYYFAKPMPADEYSSRMENK